MTTGPLCVPWWPLTLFSSSVLRSPVNQGVVSSALLTASSKIPSPFSFPPDTLLRVRGKLGGGDLPPSSQFQEELPKEKEEADPCRRWRIQQRRRQQGWWR